MRELDHLFCCVLFSALSWEEKVMNQRYMYAYDVQELQSFLSLESIGPGQDRTRPYLWASVVSTLDGVISYFEEPHHKGNQTDVERVLSCCPFVVTCSAYARLLMLFVHLNTTGPQGIALAHIEGSGSVADHRVLNFSWAHADAILTSGSTLRNEGGNTLTPWHAGKTLSAFLHFPSHLMSTSLQFCRRHNSVSH
jgi:hypothetical protein